MKEYNLAILGATGAVGQEFINLLNERDFPFKNLKLLASARSAGKELTVRGKTYKVEEAKADPLTELMLPYLPAARSARRLHQLLSRQEPSSLIIQVPIAWILRFL